MNYRTLSPSATQRRGVTLIETIVSFSLLVTVLAITAPLMVRHTRLLADGRAYRCAVDELSNRLTLLSATSPDSLTQAIEGLAAAELDGPLANARLNGEVDAIESGYRITLSLTWPDTERKRPDVILVGWSFPLVTGEGGRP